MATDITITGAAMAGMMIALLWRGIVPYLIKRKEAEDTGQKPPSFSTSYMATFIISMVGGFISVMMTVSELETKLIGVTSVMSAAAIGLTFTYTFISGLNTIVNLGSKNIQLTRQLNIFKFGTPFAPKAEKQIEKIKEQEQQSS